MALQPAAGARDLTPRDVELNRWICGKLSHVYRLWGYQEVAPPHFEHLATLEAGGGIDERELVRLVADEPLGLRPELTASIARNASTRLANRPRPLRLWAQGQTFRSLQAEGGQQRIMEDLQSGVELLGEPSAAADAELLRLLLAAGEAVGLSAAHSPKLLLSHHGILRALLEQLPQAQRQPAQAALTGFDPLSLRQLPLPEHQRERLAALMRLRGEVATVLEPLQQWLGPLPVLNQLAETLALIAPAARRLGVSLQVDPTFQPHFALYDGLVLKLVCRGEQGVPLEVASGGRYDALVGRFSQAHDSAAAAGMGFGFDVASLRQLLSSSQPPQATAGRSLICMADSSLLADALDALEALHRAGEAAELHGAPVASQGAADQVAAERGCGRAVWIAA